MENLSGGIFTPLDPDDAHLVGGVTVLMTEQLTFVSPRIIDHFFDQKTDF